MRCCRAAVRILCRERMKMRVSHRAVVVGWKLRVPRWDADFASRADGDADFAPQADRITEFRSAFRGRKKNRNE
ncbi:MAG: hypothetical protein Q4F41_05890 [Eubacteriales bacterium]|nr:hypothetical protein [Eubacteriales bacterium]